MKGGVWDESWTISGESVFASLTEQLREFEPADVVFTCPGHATQSPFYRSLEKSLGFPPRYMKMSTLTKMAQSREQAEAPLSVSARAVVVDLTNCDACGGAAFLRALTQLARDNRHVAFHIVAEIECQSNGTATAVGLPSKVDSRDRSARIWLPQLPLQGGSIVSDMRATFEPDEAWPVVEFPSCDPRLLERLVEVYWEQGINGLDFSEAVYVDEMDPLDSYKTLLRLSGSLRQAYDLIGGVNFVVSPLLRSAMAIGACLAAAESTFEIAEIQRETGQDEPRSSTPIHIRLMLSGGT